MTDSECRSEAEIDLVCIGDVGQRHEPTLIAPKQCQGEWYWTCRTCGWLLKSFLGESVIDYV